MQKTDLTASAAPLVEQAFARLRADVLAGAFAAGAKLKLDELQGLYGYSSSPLPEALSRLSQEGPVPSASRPYRPRTWPTSPTCA